MAKRNKHNTAEVDLARFENSLGELIKMCERLQVENTRLRNELLRVKAENREISVKSDMSRNKMEAIISRLKTMELEI